jgi:hypothetical protein
MSRQITRFVKPRSPILLLTIILFSAPGNTVRADTTQYDAQFAKTYPSILLLTAVLFSVSGSNTHTGAGQSKSQPRFTLSPTGTTTVTFEEHTAPGSFMPDTKPGDVTLPEVSFVSQGDPYSSDPAISPVSNGHVIGANLNVPSAGTNPAESRETSPNVTIPLADGSIVISFPAPGTIVSDPFQPGQPDPVLAPVPEPGAVATAFALFGTTAIGMVTARFKTRLRKATVPTAA